jgi:hypothetical protein
LAGVIQNGKFSALPTDEEIVFGQTLYVPPLGSKNRQIEGELGGSASTWATATSSRHAARGHHRRRGHARLHPPVRRGRGVAVPARAPGDGGLHLLSIATAGWCGGG